MSDNYNNSVFGSDIEWIGSTKHTQTIVDKLRAGDNNPETIGAAADIIETILKDRYPDCTLTCERSCRLSCDRQAV